MARNLIFKQAIQGIAFPVASHQTINGKVQVLLPGHLSLSIPDQNASILKLKHQLKIKAFTEGTLLKATSTAKVPITLGAYTMNSAAAPSSIPDPKVRKECSPPKLVV